MTQYRLLQVEISISAYTIDRLQAKLVEMD